MEYIHDSLEGFVEIIVAFFLVPANVQGFMGIKVLIDDLLHSLQELLNHIKDKIAASLQVSVEFRSVNLLAKEVHLEDQNATLQQNQWEALQRIDLVNRAIRRRYAIQRRLYNVKKPNRLWHIDSNHKLN